MEKTIKILLREIKINMLCSLFKALKRFPLTVIIKKRKVMARSSTVVLTTQKDQRHSEEDKDGECLKPGISLSCSNTEESTTARSNLRTHTPVRSEAGHRQHYKGSTIILLGNGQEKWMPRGGKRQTRIDGSNRLQDITQSESRF